MLALAYGAGFAIAVVLLPALRPRRAGVADRLRDQRADDPAAPPARAQPARRRAGTRTRSKDGTRDPGRVREVFARGVRLAVPPARPRGVPHQLLQRAVGAAHEPVPHRRARLLEHQDRGCSAPSPPACPACSASSSPAGSPRRAAGDRSRSSGSSSATRLPDGVLPRRRRGAVDHGDVRDRRRRCAAIALGAFDTELFPTEVRGTSNALLPRLRGRGLGRRAARSRPTSTTRSAGSAPRSRSAASRRSLAAAFVVPCLPEPADRDARRHQPVGGDEATTDPTSSAGGLHRVDVHARRHEPAGVRARRRAGGDRDPRGPRHHPEASRSAARVVDAGFTRVHAVAVRHARASRSTGATRCGRCPAAASRVSSRRSRSTGRARSSAGCAGSPPRRTPSAAGPGSAPSACASPAASRSG